MENGKYVVLLYEYDVVEVGDLFVILHIYDKSFSLSYKAFDTDWNDGLLYKLFSNLGIRGKM